MLGWTPQYIAKLLRGENLGISPVITLLEALPEINARWLLLGQGDMLEAVVWYVWAAQRGSKKALYTLLNMGATGSLYFFDQPIAAIAKQLTEKDTF